MQASAEAGWDGGPRVHSPAAAGAFLLVLVPLQLLYRYRHGKENVCRKGFVFFFSLNFIGSALNRTPYVRFGFGPI